MKISQNYQDRKEWDRFCFPPLEPFDQNQLTQAINVSDSRQLDFYHDSLRGEKSFQWKVMSVLFFLTIFHFKTGEVLFFNEIFWLQEKKASFKKTSNSWPNDIWVDPTALTEDHILWRWLNWNFTWGGTGYRHTMWFSGHPHMLDSDRFGFACKKWYSKIHVSPSL